jgi:ABC-2 type transport system ATP-binding protein
MAAVSVLRTEGLLKRFGDLVAVDHLALDVREGDLYGFLGLNGAGKTTTIRMAVGLLRPTAGRVLIFGRDVRTHFFQVMPRLGALVEIPAFYPYLTGRENLELLRRLSGYPDRRCVGEALERVGLAARAGDRVRGYSQGMRQRLGIAQALLTRPSLVILDEPTNGLDPQGIADIRALIRRLNREDGVTVLLSSHQLYEVEITCTRVGILHEGRLVREATTEALLRGATGRARVRASPPSRAEAICRAFPGAGGIESGLDGSLRLRIDAEALSRLNAALVQGGCAVYELSPEWLTLEELFLAELRNAGAADSGGRREAVAGPQAKAGGAA